MSKMSDATGPNVRTKPHKRNGARGKNTRRVAALGRKREESDNHMFRMNSLNPTLDTVQFLRAQNHKRRVDTEIEVLKSRVTG